MPLQLGAQVVVHQPDSSGGGRCRAFTGLPATTPAWIRIDAATPADRLSAQRLGGEIVALLGRLNPGMREIRPPCSGWNYGDCHARSTPDCVKILLPVFTAKSSYKIPAAWRTKDVTFRVAPVLTSGTDPSVLSAALRKLNAVRWSPGDPTGLFDLLRLARIISDRRRVFISYVRADSDPLAEQLFDALGKRGFDVFMDRFRLDPGVDFQVRLLEELSRIGSVLVLESPGILKSRWVRHEIDFARKYQLGRMALALAGGSPKVPGIPAASRVQFGPGDLTGKAGKLRALPLRQIVARLEALHARAEQVRIAYLRDNLSRALAMDGFLQQGFDPGGTVLARKSAMHAFRVCNLPAELGDFQAIDAHRAWASTSHVVAPARFMDWRSRASLDWLAARAGIQMDDHAEMPAVLKGLA